jgi:HD superfamily phosphohydrolase
MYNFLVKGSAIRQIEIVTSSKCIKQLYLYRICVFKLYINLFFHIGSFFAADGISNINLKFQNNSDNEKRLYDNLVYCCLHDGF